MQAHFRIHIFMDDNGAIDVSFALQIGRHAAVTVNIIVAVVEIIYLLLDFCFFCVIICLLVFLIVIVGI